MTGASLEIKAASVRMEGADLLGPVDLILPGGGITMVMGPNGAGKSLFLRLVHGLMAPTRGTVAWDGVAATASQPARGFMFQQTPLMRRSVAANVEFPLRAAGVGAAERKARVAEALDRVRLGGRARLPAARLSGGERQRMAMARALIRQPGALLLDEPSASLDPASTADLEGLIRDVAKAGVTVLMSTHDIGQARRLADHVLFFDKGALVENAPAGAVLADPQSDAARDYLEGRL